MTPVGHGLLVNYEHTGDHAKKGEPGKQINHNFESLLTVYAENP